MAKHNSKLSTASEPRNSTHPKCVCFKRYQKIPKVLAWHTLRILPRQYPEKRKLNRPSKPAAAASHFKTQKTPVNRVVSSWGGSLSVFVDCIVREEQKG